jgi:hypothetical protein
MTLDKEQVSKIITLLLAFLVGLLAVFGYDVGVIQPREQSLPPAKAGAAIEQAAATPGLGALDCVETLPAAP